MRPQNPARKLMKSKTVKGWGPPYCPVASEGTQASQLMVTLGRRRRRSLGYSAARGYLHGSCVLRPT